MPTHPAFPHFFEGALQGASASDRPPEEVVEHAAEIADLACKELDARAEADRIAAEKAKK